MTSNHRASKAGRSTINYYRLPLDKQQSFERDAFLAKDCAAKRQPKQSTQSESRSPDRRLTTPQLVSALTGIWNLVGQVEASDTTQRLEDHVISHKEGPLCFSSDQTGHVLTSCSAESLRSPRSKHCSSATNSIYENLRSVKKTLMLRSCSSTVGATSTCRHVHAIDKLGNMHFVQLQSIYSIQTKKTENIGTSKNSGLSSMSKESDAISTNMDDKEHQFFRRDDSHSSQARNMPTKISCASSSEEANIAHASQNSLQDTNLNIDIVRQDSNSLTSACSFQQTTTGKEAVIVSGNPISSNVCTHVQLEQSASPSRMVGDSLVGNSANVDQHSYMDSMCQQHSVDGCSPDFESSLKHRFHNVVTVNRHALAGALAGTVVSLCLHPVDTVKTIIQANNSGQSSFYHTLRNTLVERGMLGLYGGIASKIACSAPVSAIYTLTYESVKGALLPILPKEYHSIAHCTAGGCSSIATSFVFTPSECIKQQMQVGSQYQNCWNALIGCLQRGGIASLYAGWGAVLCRNIPHSIVKFYAYESLKRFLLKSAPANAKLDSSQTILCGGFAGSAAALFTTPFDVVKTRIQLQALSPVSKYQGVLHALKDTFQHEGLRGLYRGLTPRLAMYISQGAIFFTSYEFLKTILFPEQVPPARKSF